MTIPTFDPKSFLVLVVDDVPSNLKVVQGILSQVGYSMTFATGGLQAIERTQKAHPDLILLDLMMPDLDGIDVCKRLQSDPATRSIPVVFLTASHERQHLLKAFETGAVDYITKPFNAPELMARVKTHLQLRFTTKMLQMTLNEVERLARTDSLTETLNRRTLFAVIDQELQRLRRYNRIFSLILLDVDHFKAVNDRYGHIMGDRVLKQIATQIQSELRCVDTIGRYGGEEFVLLLPETDVNAAKDTAERIRCLVEGMTFDPPEQDSFQLTLSLGIIGVESGDVAVDELIHRADLALYQAKSQGRNRWMLYSEIHETSTEL